jgi:hypothetical protein
LVGYNDNYQRGYSNDKVTNLIPADKLKSYTEAFDEITKQTGVKDIDELVKNFIEAEERVRPRLLILEFYTLSICE